MGHRGEACIRLSYRRLLVIDLDFELSEGASFCGGKRTKLSSKSFTPFHVAHESSQISVVPDRRLSENDTNHFAAQDKCGHLASVSDLYELKWYKTSPEIIPKLHICNFEYGLGALSGSHGSGLFCSGQAIPSSLRFVWISISDLCKCLDRRPIVAGS